MTEALKIIEELRKMKHSKCIYREKEPKVMDCYLVDITEALDFLEKEIRPLSKEELKEELNLFLSDNYKDITVTSNIITITEKRTEKVVVIAKSIKGAGVIIPNFIDRQVATKITRFLENQGGK